MCIYVRGNLISPLGINKVYISIYLSMDGWMDESAEGALITYSNIKGWFMAKAKLV